jgi:type VI secretion system protein VasG
VAAADGQGVLDRYAVDLTARARAGDIDPVTGRDQEIRRMIDILMRRRQNNPLLTGEAGVGKTAVVEGLALRLARGDVPPALREVTLYMLDLGLLQAGAGMKGEFEQRLRQVIDAVTASERPAVLFIDEIHTLVGAGGAAGTGDAANLLKPALARGQLRTIGATTWAEYKKYIETDPALTRRFQVIQVNEPSQEQAIAMTRGLASALERHHGVLLLDEAIEACVHLSHRYIPARQLPDKAVALLDTACARVAISQHATPGQIEDARSRIAALEIEREGLAREAQLGMDREGRLKACAQQLADAQLLLAKLENRWSAEQALAGRVSALRTALQAPAATAVNEDQEALSALRDAQSELASLQEEAQLVFPSVDAAAVAAVVSEWTGASRGRTAACAGSHCPAHSDFEGQTLRSKQARRRISPVRSEWRRQDGNGAGACRHAVWWRAQRHHHQHERIPGVSYSFHAQGGSAGICWLWRRRCPDRGCPAPSLQRGSVG